MAQLRSDDWGARSHDFEEIKIVVGNKDLTQESEAQTRFDIVDRMIKEVFGWRYGQIKTEDRQEEPVRGYVDYYLKCGDIAIVIEAKKIGISFPTPTREKKLKIRGSILGSGEINKAIKQALEYSKSKIAQITLVTNGLCWCFFNSEGALNNPDEYAYLLFPFSNDKDAEELFNYFSNLNIGTNGMDNFFEKSDVQTDNRLLNIVNSTEPRVDRNNVADFISPALDRSFFQEGILNNPDNLERCYVQTSMRSKYDSTLEMYLADTKPTTIAPASRIKPGKVQGQLQRLVEQSTTAYAPPVTLIIAPVGVGKSTYLRHFELVSGKNILADASANWIYIDFEELGRSGDPRKYIYKKLRDYLLDPKNATLTDFENAVKPAYKDEIDGMLRGPYKLISNNIDEVNKIITEHISSEFHLIEPYVDKVFGYLSRRSLCIIVLDNTDLYEDSELEKTVIAEGLAIAKRLLCHVIISIRDTTFVKHKNDSLFDAYEFRKLWLDPPPFKEVLSRRLKLSGELLEGRYAKIPTANGRIQIEVPNLRVFFEIVQRSLLDGVAGDFIEALSNSNIRKGLSLVKNFLMSGHIHADKALSIFLTGQQYTFPFQEIYKGTILGQYKYYKEQRSEALNLFDSRLISRSLRLLRLYTLGFLYQSARAEKTLEVQVEKCFEIFSNLGANPRQIVTVLQDLNKFDLIKTGDAMAVNEKSNVHITRTGGYYYKSLVCRLVYAETSMYDTAIDDLETWHKLENLTHQIEREDNILVKMRVRKQRFQNFIEYLMKLESQVTWTNTVPKDFSCLDVIKESVLNEFNFALDRLQNLQGVKKL